ncbi:hypothetical protein PCAR4_350185 [Paraburkholderia caribensis]|nr:hypothetical protein PCAR4_350185 [Paraburkholderia caribensis]
MHSLFFAHQRCRNDASRRSDPFAITRSIQRHGLTHHGVLLSLAYHRDRSDIILVYQSKFLHNSAESLAYSREIVPFILRELRECVDYHCVTSFVDPMPDSRGHNRPIGRCGP